MKTLFCHSNKDNILAIQQLDNGTRLYKSEKYEIDYYTIDSQSYNSLITTPDGLPLKKVNKFSVPTDMRYGDIDPCYAWLYDNQTNTTFSDPVIAYMDIEVLHDVFPEPINAEGEVTCIAYYMPHSNQSVIITTVEYDKHIDNIRLVKCDNEKELLARFLKEWYNDKIEIISGYNVDGFDMPYLVNRITKILGKQYCNHLIPCFDDGEVIGKYPSDRYKFVGIEVLDYMKLLKTHPHKKPPNYKLDTVAEHFGVGNKLDYDGTLTDLHRDNPQRYVEYCLQDCILIHKLENKLGIIKIALAISAIEGVNPSDKIAGTRIWDTIYYRYYRSKNIAIPPKTKNSNEEYEGGAVLDPVAGLHKSVCSIDIDSLYPNSVIQFNISSDTFLGKVDGYNGGVQLTKNDNIIMPNGCVFKRDIDGIFPQFMSSRYERRKEAKSEMKKLFKIKQKLLNME